METRPRSQICYQNAEKFKSYYVVWKPLQKNVLFLRIFGSLNRTMQYGNFIAYLYTFSPRAGLNRTMQYGNIRKVDEIWHKTYGLNRTMQYGNQFNRMLPPKKKKV